jgi:hypothetical protein
MNTATYFVRPVQIAFLFALFSAVFSVAAQPASPGQNANSVSFQGLEYLHRWSKSGQHEYTPKDQADLKSWQDMITLNVHEAVTDADKLSAIANTVLSNYQSAGKILRTDSKPRTADSPAEHLIVAVLGAPDFIEAVFARFVLNSGVGLVVVHSHRVYGKSAGPAMSTWLQANGPQIEAALMGWNQIPNIQNLRLLSK